MHLITVRLPNVHTFWAVFTLGTNMFILCTSPRSGFLKEELEAEIHIHVIYF